MFKKYLYYLRKSDWLLSLIAIFLVAFGMMAIYSIEATSQDPDFVNFKKQLIFFGVGCLLLIFFSLMDYRYLKTYSLILLVFGLIILFAVLLVGTTIKGTKGWLFLFGEQGFQPVEVIKIIMIIVLAKYFADFRAKVTRIKNLLIVLAVSFSLIILVFLQPDFGSAFILITIFLGMLLMTKIKKSYLFWIALILLAAVIAGWLFVLQDYQKDRVLTFLNPERDPWGSGYSIKQSIIAVGSGQFFGRGLLLGPQSRLDFLPVQETDFIFAVIAEELGFFGATLLLIFIFVMVYRLLRICRLARYDFGLFLVSGIIIYFVAQSVLNIGMNIGVLPIAGVPLPLVSYGGSSLITSFIALGIAQSIYIRHGLTATP